MPSNSGEVASRTEFAAPCSAVLWNSGGLWSRSPTWRWSLVRIAPGFSALAVIPSPAQRSVAPTREQDVGRLGLAVGEARVVRAVAEVQVVEDHGRDEVRGRADGDDPCVAGVGERAAQTAGEREVPEVVGRELQLPAFGGALFRRGHHAGVVDEDVQRSVPFVDECGDRGTVGEVEGRDVDATVDLGRDARSGGAVADGERDGRAGTGERAGGLDADAGGASGDDRAAAREVDSGHDLRRRGVEVEGGCDAGHDDHGGSARLV